MNSLFAGIIESFEPKLRLLSSSDGCSPLALPPEAPKQGIYVLYEDDRPMYVGRSNRIPNRLSNHCRERATYRMAAFAFRLARAATGMTKAGYTNRDSRKALMEIPKFAEAFIEAKKRIRDMSVRFVEETDPTSQALLEIYVAIALKTPYNDFNTH